MKLHKENAGVAEQQFGESDQDRGRGGHRDNNRFIQSQKSVAQRHSKRAKQLRNELLKMDKVSNFTLSVQNETCRRKYASDAIYKLTLRMVTAIHIHTYILSCPNLS